MAVTVDQATRIIRKYHPDDQSPAVVDTLQKVTNVGYSYNANIASYTITLKREEEQETYLLYVEETGTTSPPSDSDHRANGLSVIYNLLSKIKNNSSIPMPQGILDANLDIIPHECILFTMPSGSSQTISLSTARSSGMLDAQGLARIELELGAYLGQLHAIQNDWFGLPSIAEPAEPSYSWQESFVFLFETLLEEIKPLPMSKRLDLSFEDIQRYLSRAIGFFLFDDVEVPALIGFAISEDDILVHVPDEASPTAAIETILPNFSWAVWGDPLLESLFMPPGPSPAVMEGYTGAGGTPPIVFPRQKTKRLWYSLYLSLLILCKGESCPKETSEDSANITWALRTAQECAKALKDAPCY
ncbi:hypothetical protein PC9H_001991 [Pleurotus ostreatus]|uniref:Aminoglycoside phosphotransferase domain-containing protein n=1 Tax=Pleurotus ostreatus TaxID=5322 RepID=A0A8H6ZMK0_PLEOS|nr:uncharacterized protein PC9H_001991 [Pleurotus ostreatus]KAF7419401.1 hypothetical protein PC9H_001991 [Pleurotus ostreatus]KAJ8689807.1 hypothetical protein PTI98_012668 [Pleurotus ostreatus]